MVLRRYSITTRKHAESTFPGTIHSWIHHQFNPLSTSKSHFLPVTSLEGEYSVDINCNSLAKEAAPDPSIPNPSSIQNPDSPDSSENSLATPSKIPISTQILRQQPQKDYCLINDPQYHPQKGNESVM